MADKRQYEPIWEQIKRDGFCDVATHRAWHARVKKAVTKEKNMDLGYKLECSERYPPVVAILITTRDGSILRFRLAHKLSITIDTI